MKNTTGTSVVIFTSNGRYTAVKLIGERAKKRKNPEQLGIAQDFLLQARGHD